MKKLKKLKIINSSELKKIKIYYNNFNLIVIGTLGIGDWGLGIGDWGLGPIPNPQSPIPNHSKI